MTDKQLVYKLLHDPTYEGGVQYWIQKHDAEMLAHACLRGATARLCRAVSRRMQADEPTPEDRLELLEAYDAASAFLANDKAEGRPAERTNTQ
jgi:hypothetical protein